MNLTCDGFPVNSGRIEHETFTAQDVFAAKQKGIELGEMFARRESNETIEILRHNLKTALLVLDGTYSLTPDQREILDKAASGIYGETKDITSHSCGSSTCGNGCNTKREAGL